MANEHLRNHLIEISRALLECKNDNPVEILGFPDNLKLLSSMTLFDLIAPEIKEFDKVLDKFFDGYRDDRTIDFLLN